MLSCRLLLLCLLLHPMLAVHWLHQHVGDKSNAQQTGHCTHGCVVQRRCGINRANGYNFHQSGDGHSFRVHQQLQISGGGTKRIFKNFGVTHTRQLFAGTVGAFVSQIRQRQWTCNPRGAPTSQQSTMNTTHVLGPKYVGQISGNGSKPTPVHGKYNHC